MYITHLSNALPDKLEILINDRVIDLYYKDGKSFVEGRRGSAYKIRFTNNSSNRKKIVLSVDGINVVTGDRDWQRGYVVNPWQTVTIPGWTKDNNNVAKFVFSSVDRSYNQRTDGHDVNNVGVIGCLVYNQKYVTPEIKYVYHNHYHHDDWWPKKYYYSSPTVGGAIGYGVGVGWGGLPQNSITSSLNAGQGSASSTLRGIQCSAGSNEIQALLDLYSNVVEPETPDQNVGTGYGSNAEFKTTEVSYEFEASTCGEYTIYYDDADGLRRRGIYVNRVRHQNTPDPFPGRTVGVPAPVR